MGVPKFYRWISERYPKINQIVSDSTLLPEFDNLYLDMNGILHTCTHPNDDGLSAQLSERDIILGIFHYIDRIVTHIVRPRKVLYMAIDGVAPRAKMNQQRSRRFRARKDMQEAKLIAESKGEVVDDGAVFDSNCITPGTEFMAKISRHLRYFIQKKITEDPLWKALTVTFSGHEIPGEGEHKIMAYIRDERAAGRLPANTRHCMYGQDADLILLGLVTHEPHFTLLREVVNFGQNAAKGKNASKVVVKTTRDAQFQLLHLSVLREYIWAEFTRDVPEETESEMDRERVVDDFVFLTFLVGNDFLPHMPSLDIGEEAFSLLFQIYRRLKPGWGSGAYLTNEGTIDDADRLEQFLAEVGAREDEIFSDRAEEEAEFRGRRRKNSKRFGRADEVPSEAEIALQEQKLQQTYENAMIDAMGYVPETPDGGKDYKGRYYFEKFGITPIHAAIHERLQAAYVEGLIWCLAYYYRGCISWGWFFPFHYVPMISDLTGLRKTFGEVRFDLGEPFLPFEQLLGCLPGASAGFLPSPYARLMLSPDSPIIDFYPEDFEIDMNGKRNPWEAVNVLPFIDAFRLREAVKEISSSALTPEEAERNTRGQVVEYYNDPTMSRKEMSCNPEIGLADIPQCSAASRVVAFSIEPGECFKPEIPPDSIIPTAGFPSLHVLPVGSVEERQVPVNVFGTASRYETVVLQLKLPPQLPPASALASKVLGRSAFVNWPLMHEAQVVGISDEKEEYRLVEVKGSSKRKTNVRTFNKEDANRWRLRAAEEQGSYLTGRGVPGSGGVDIGRVQLMLKARPLQGMRVDPATGARRKVFGQEEAEVPVHLALWSHPSEDPRFVEREKVTIEERFPIGSRVTCLHGGHGHGCGGEVVGHEGSKVDVRVDLRPPEPPFGMAIVQSVKTAYFSQRKACETLGIRPQVFGRIVGSVNVDPGKMDLGLNLKQNGRYQLLGYSRCVLRKEAAWSTSDTVRVVGSAAEAEDIEASSWEFSAAALQLIARYARAFPQLFHGLGRLGGERFFEANALLGQGGKQKAGEIVQWLSELETAAMQRVPLTTRALSREAVKAVERGADVRQAVLVKNAMIKKIVLKGLEPSKLLPYDVADHTDAPMDTGGEKPALGDRVVNMRAKGVPFGIWGTVVACHSHSGCVEVVFDEEFIGGTTLHSMCSNYRGALVPWATVAKIHTKARLKALRAAAAAAPQGGAASSTASPQPPAGASSAKGQRKAKSQPPAPGSDSKKVSLLRPANTPNQAPQSAGRPNTAGAKVSISSTDALKGALGIGLNTRPPPPPQQPAASASTAGSGATSVPPSTGVVEQSASALSASTASSSSSAAAAAAAGALLKGMLGVEAADGSRVVVRDGGGEGAGAGGPGAGKRPFVNQAAAAASGAAAADSSMATANLKAMIGVGLMKPSQVVAASSEPVTAPPVETPGASGGGGGGGTAVATSVGVGASRVAFEHSSNVAADRAAGGERTITPPPPPWTVGGFRVTGGGRGTPSRMGARARLGMSPEASERRGAAQFRQAKGPDKHGTGFKTGRGFGAGRGGGPTTTGAAKAAVGSAKPDPAAGAMSSGTKKPTSVKASATTSTRGAKKATAVATPTATAAPMNKPGDVCAITPGVSATSAAAAAVTGAGTGVGRQVITSSDTSNGLVTVERLSGTAAASPSAAASATVVTAARAGEVPGSEDLAAATVSSRLGAGAVAGGASGVAVKTTGVDFGVAAEGEVGGGGMDATTLRVVENQAKSLAEATSRQAVVPGSGASKARPAPMGTTAPPAVPSSTGVAPSKGQQLMNMIGAGRPSQPPPTPPTPDVSLPPGSSSPERAKPSGSAGVVAVGGIDGARAPALPLAKDPKHQHHQSQEPPPQEQQQQRPTRVAPESLAFPPQQGFLDPGVPRGAAYIQPRLGMGMAMGVPTSPALPAQGPVGDAQRVLWQQQRVLDAIQQQQAQTQQQHHLLLHQQQQHMQRQFHLQQHVARHGGGGGGGGGVYEQIGGYAGAVPRSVSAPTGAAVFRQPPLYGYRPGVVAPHMQPMAGYPRAPLPQGRATSAAAPSSQASNIIPRKPRNASNQKKKAAGGDGVGGASAMMIPSSALLVTRSASRRSSKADVVGPTEGGDVDSRVGESSSHEGGGGRGVVEGRGSDSVGDTRGADGGSTVSEDRKKES